MPCYYTGSAAGDEALAAHEALEEVQKERLKLTRLLCTLCKQLEADNIDLDPEVEKWWQKHKKQDAKSKIGRKAAE